jgi:hypothetical protein
MPEPCNRSGVFVRRRSFSTQLGDVLPLEQQHWATGLIVTPRQWQPRGGRARTTRPRPGPPSVGRSVDLPAQLSTANWGRDHWSPASLLRQSTRPDRVVPDPVSRDDRPTVGRVAAPGAGWPRCCPPVACIGCARVTYAVTSDARRISRSTGEGISRGKGFAATAADAGRQAVAGAGDRRRPTCNALYRRRAATVDDTNDVLIPHATRSATHWLLLLLLLLTLPLLMDPSRRCCVRARRAARQVGARLYVYSFDLRPGPTVVA